MGPDEAVEFFWRQARVKGKLNRLESITGQNVQDSVPPPVWATSADPATATADVEALLESGRLEQVVSVAELDDAGQDQPHIGDLAIVLDGHDEPRALVRTRQVTLADSHPDQPETTGQVVVEDLELLFPRRRRSRDRVKT